MEDDSRTYLNLPENYNVLTNLTLGSLSERLHPGGQQSAHL